MKLVRLSVIAICLPAFACGVAPADDAGNYLSLVGDGDELQLLESPLDRGYAAAYQNPRGLTSMEVEVTEDGELVTSCTGPTGATSCSEPPFFTAVTREGGVRRVQVWDHHGVLVAEPAFDGDGPGDDGRDGTDEPPPEDDCDDGDPDGDPDLEITGSDSDHGGDDGDDGDDGDGCDEDDDGDGDGDDGDDGDAPPQCVELHESSRDDFCRRVNERMQELNIDYELDCDVLADDVNLEDLDVDPPDIELGCDDIIDDIEDDLDDDADDADCDDVEDAIEVWETNIRATLMQDGVCGSSPLVLDLDGDGIRLSSIEDGARFDLLGSGERVRTAWPTGGDAFLVLDRNGNGSVDGAAELFGNATAGGHYTDGFAALAELDESSDGRIDAKDEAWDSLRLWNDADRDGASQPGELRTLASAGVASLDLDAQLVPGRDEHGNRIPLVSTFTRADGSGAALVDAFFRFDPPAGGADDAEPGSPLEAPSIEGVLSLLR